MHEQMPMPSPPSNLFPARLCTKFKKMDPGCGRRNSVELHPDHQEEECQEAVAGASWFQRDLLKLRYDKFFPDWIPNSVVRASDLDWALLRQAPYIIRRGVAMLE